MVGELNGVKPAAPNEVGPVWYYVKRWRPRPRDVYLYPEQRLYVKSAR